MQNMFLANAKISIGENKTKLGLQMAKIIRDLNNEIWRGADLGKLG